jgi:hypothetical protein
MGYNQRKKTGLSTSINFRFDVLAAIDYQVDTLKKAENRSAWLNGMAEHLLGIRDRPDIVGRDFPFREAKEQPWLKDVVTIKAKTTQGKRTGPTPKGGLVKRPKRG